MIEILGKQNKKVPVLLTAEMRKALELLIKTRNIADIPSGNPYVFPQVKINEKIAVFKKENHHDCTFIQLLFSRQYFHTFI